MPMAAPKFKVKAVCNIYATLYNESIHAYAFVGLLDVSAHM